MSVFSKMLMAVGVSAVLAGAAYAAGEPWVLRTDMGYVVDKDGKAMVENLNTMDKAMMTKATAVPKGMVFFMKDGHLMWVDTTK